jgi:hypothetical protein
MDRDSTAAFQTEIVKSANRPCHLVQIVFDSETLYMSDAFKNISYGGNTYIGASDLLSFSDIEEAVVVIVSKITVSLSGVDKTWISKILSQDYIDRTVKIYTAFLDTSFDLIADPVLIFEGRIDEPAITEEWESGKSTVSVGCTNAWVDFTRNTGRHTNHEEQNIRFSGDKGFEFASEIVKDIRWGVA